MKIYISPNGDWWSESGGEARLTEASFEDIDGMTTSMLQSLYSDAGGNAMAREEERDNLVDLLCKTCFAQYQEMLEE